MEPYEHTETKMANNCYIGLKECDLPKGREVTEFESKYCPPHGNPAYSFTCDVPCASEPQCYDIQEGEVEFTAPATVYGICGLKKSYLVVKVDGDCETPWTAVWPTGKVLVDVEGEYKIKYKWDACCDVEPQFGISAGCPCP